MVKTFGESRQKPEGLYAVTHVGLQEITMHPFGSGDLKIDGVQFSTPSTTGTANNALATVGPATAQPPVMGDIYEMEMGLTSAIRQEGTAGSTVQWMWQARDINRGQAWRNLMSAWDSTVADDSTAYAENTYSGRVSQNDVLGTLPFEIQLVVRRQDNVSLKGVAKVKNSTFVKAVTSGLYKRALD